MGTKEQIDAATAKVRSRLADGATEGDISALIRDFDARGTPDAPAFDPYQLRQLAWELTEVEATRPRGVVLIRALTTAQPNGAHNWATRAMIGHYRTKDFTDIILAATRAIDRGLDGWMIYLERGNALLERADPAAALADLDRALTFSPSDRSEKARLEALREEARRAVNAIRVVRELHDELAAGKVSSWELVRRWSPIPLTPADYGDVAKGKRKLAIDFEWSIRVTYSIAEHAYAFFDTGEYRFVRQVFGALALVNAFDPYMKAIAAAADVKLGDSAAAIAGYGEALALDPKSKMALVNRGELLLNRGDVARALTDLAAAIELDPGGVDPYANRARAIAWAVAEALPEHHDRAVAIRGPLRLSASADAVRLEIAAKLRASTSTASAALPTSAVHPATPTPREDRRGAPVRILFLAANPSDQTRLSLTREVERFSERLRATSHRDAFEIVQHWEVEAVKLQGLILRHRPQIVHFSGHGTKQGELVFQDAEGASAPLPAALLANVFAILNKYVRCVVLNACFSRSQADAIVRSVDVVVGMSDAIRDTDAIAFAGSFYEALGYGEDVKTAFDLARNAVGIEARATPGDGHAEAGRNLAPADRARRSEGRVIPELLTRSGVNPAEVRFVES